MPGAALTADHPVVLRGMPFRIADMFWHPNYYVCRILSTV